jgi:hypothetical protein
VTGSELFRVILSAAAVLVLIGCIGEMWYGPRREMFWSQFLRYLALSIITTGILVAQYNHRHLPITGYTETFAVGLIVGALGVSPRLKVPMRKAKP